MHTYTTIIINSLIIILNTHIHLLVFCFSVMSNKRQTRSLANLIILNSKTLRMFFNQNLFFLIIFVVIFLPHYQPDISQFPSYSRQYKLSSQHSHSFNLEKYEIPFHTGRITFIYIPIMSNMLLQENRNKYVVISILFYKLFMESCITSTLKSRKINHKITCIQWNFFFGYHLIEI